MYFKKRSTKPSLLRLRDHFEIHSVNKILRLPELCQLLRVKLDVVSIVLVPWCIPELLTVKRSKDLFWEIKRKLEF